MSTLKFRGDTQPQRQVDFLTPANVEIGDVFTATINRKDISFTATAATVANVVAGLVAAINANAQDIPEFDEVEASVGTDDDGNSTHVIVTGPEDGKPFTLTAGTTNAGELGVDVETLQEGAADVNEIQRVVLAGPPTGGTFTLTFDGQTTAAINYNDNAATITTALEGLANIAPGDVTVTGTGVDFTVEFEGAYAGVNVPLMTGSGSNLTGGATVTVATTTQGAGGVNEVQLITRDSTLSSNWGLIYAGEQTSWLAPAATAADVQAALEALSTIGSGNVTVTRSGPHNPGTYFTSEYRWRVTFINALGNQDIDQSVDGLFFDEGGNSTSEGNVTVATAGSSSTTNEVQTVTVKNAPTGGTFTLTFSGQTTAAQAFNESAANLQTDLEALSTIGAGNIAVARTGSGTLSSPYIYTCTFQGTLAGTDVSEMTANAGSLTGSGVSISVSQESDPGQNEQQQITLSGSPAGGTFTLTWDPGGGDETTGNIAYDASASTVQTALEGLATPAPGDFTVTGPAGGPWIVEFKATYAETDVNEMTGDGTNLTGGGTQTLTRSSSVTPTGPNWVDNAENYSSGSLPVNGDTLIFEDSDIDALYGIDQLSAVTLAELRIESSYTGRIGLPDWTGLYYEYRPTYFAIGATVLKIGEGTGSGSPRLKINTGTVQTTIDVLQTASPEDAGLPAILWKGTHASNAVRVYRGSFGAALLAGEAATILTLHVGYIDNQDGDSTVLIGSGVTLGTVTKSGGVLSVECAIGTAFTQYVDGGVATLAGTGAVAQLTILGGVVYYNTSGTLGGNTVVAVDGGLNFSQDSRSKTVTNPIESTVGSPMVDPLKVAGNIVIDFNQVTAVDFSKLGANVRWTRGTPS
jgi:hypothetical protein